MVETWNTGALWLQLGYSWGEPCCNLRILWVDKVRIAPVGRWFNPVNKLGFIHPQPVQDFIHPQQHGMALCGRFWG